IENPIDREALQRDPDLLSQTVEEILRLFHPMDVRAEQPEGIPRWANADIPLDDVTIPAGDLVVLSGQSANMDERVFNNPKAFEPRRAENPHLTFGYGPHFCMGAPLARIELQTVFGTLFRRFPGLRLAIPAESLRLRTNLITVGGCLAELPVTW